MKRHVDDKHPEKHAELKLTGQGNAFTFSQENFRKALLQWVVECNQPFTEPQQEAFVKFIGTLNPNAKVVSDKTIKSDLLAEFADKLNQLKTKVAAIPGKISITMDAWTSKNVLSFLAIRGHWLDDKWNYQTKLLDFASIEGAHSGFNLSKNFSDCLERLEIPFKKIMAVTLDNATNNDTFFDWLEHHGITAVDNRMRCMAHIINLSVQDILKSLKVAYVADVHEYDDAEDELENEDLEDIDLNEEISDIEPDDDDIEEQYDGAVIVKLRTLVKKIRKSVKLRQKLKKLCLAYGMKYLVPILDICTRWNSSYHMICRADQLTVPLRSLCTNEKTLTKLRITNSEWNELTNIKQLLKKFDRATNLMSLERHSTNSAYLPTLNWLITTLTNYVEQNSGPLSNAARCGLLKLKKYELDINVAKLPFIRTFLHPGLKLLYFKEHDYNRNTIRTINTEILGYFEKNYGRAVVIEKPPLKRKRNNDVNVELDTDDDDDLFKDMFKRSKVAKESTEFNKYINWPLTREDTNTVEFWQSHQKEFPRMSLMARDVLPIQSGSVSVERDFSRGVDVVTPKRCSLKENTIQATMCLKSWYKN